MTFDLFARWTLSTIGEEASGSSKVPVLLDRRDGVDGVVISQSNAIMLHVADAAPGTLAPAGSGSDRSRFRERFLYFVTDVIAPSHSAFALRSTKSTEAPLTLLELSKAAMEEAERFLQESRFMAGDEFTLVDVLAFTFAHSIAGEISWARRPLLHSWYERLKDRPSILRGLSAFD